MSGCRKDRKEKLSGNMEKKERKKRKKKRIKIMKENKNS
jgi:hypothetical protein